MKRFDFGKYSIKSLWVVIAVICLCISLPIQAKAQIKELYHSPHSELETSETMTFSFNVPSDSTVYLSFYGSNTYGDALLTIKNSKKEIVVTKDIHNYFDNQKFSFSLPAGNYTGILKENGDFTFEYEFCIYTGTDSDNPFDYDDYDDDYYDDDYDDTCYHDWDEWIITRKATVSSEGKKERECFMCGETEYKVIPKLKPTGKISPSSIKVEETRYYDNLKITDLAAGDKVASYKSGNKKIFTVNSKGRILGVKQGTSTLTVVLKSGKKLTAKVTVTKYVPVKRKKLAKEKWIALKKDDYSNPSYTFKTTKKGAVSFDITCNLYDIFGRYYPCDSSKYFIKLEISDSQYNLIDKYTFKFDNTYFSTGYYILMGKELKKGTYHVEVIDHNIPDQLNCEIGLTPYWSEGIVETATFPKSITVTEGKGVVIKPKKMYPQNGLFFASNKMSNSNASTYFNSNGELVLYGNKAGSSVLTLKLLNNKSVKINVTVKKGKTISLNENDVYLLTGQTRSLKLYNATKNISWSSSNKKVAIVDKQGKITAKGAGSCKITAKYKNKTYKCSVEVINHTPITHAYIQDYNTRNNYFSVRFTNNSKKDIIISSGKKVEEEDYKTFDRSIYLKKSVTIKPGKSATIRFYVKGETTWYDHTSYTLFYKFKYRGKEFDARCYSYGSGDLKIDKKWCGSVW